MVKLKKIITIVLALAVLSSAIQTFAEEDATSPSTETVSAETPDTPSETPLEEGEHTSFGDTETNTPTEEPSTDEPSTDEPSTDEPSTDEPATDEPATDEPSTDQPATDEPSTDEPKVEEPKVEEFEEPEQLAVSYILPTDSNITLDPFGKLDTGDSQIFSKDFAIINKSNVPIKVVVKPVINITDSSVIIKNSPEEVGMDINSTDKELYIESVFADTVVIDPENTHAANITTKEKGTVALGKSINPAFNTDNGADTQAKAVIGGLGDRAEMVIALNPAVYTSEEEQNLFSEIATHHDGTVAGATTFRFMGKINSMAQWTGREFTISVLYTVEQMENYLYNAEEVKQHIPPTKPQEGPAEIAAFSMLSAVEEAPQVVKHPNILFVRNANSGGPKWQDIYSAAEANKPIEPPAIDEPIQERPQKTTKPEEPKEEAPNEETPEQPGKPLPQEQEPA